MNKVRFVFSAAAFGAAFAGAYASTAPSNDDLNIVAYYINTDAQGHKSCVVDAVTDLCTRTSGTRCKVITASTKDAYLSNVAGTEVCSSAVFKP